MDKHYMIVACRNKCEVACAEFLREKFGSAIDVVLFFERVMVKPRHRKSAQAVPSDRPVYSGYIFVWLEPGRAWVELKGCKHVYGVLSYDGVPYYLPQERLVPTMPQHKKRTSLLPGTPVRVLTGAMQGSVGTFVRNGMIELNMFGRITRVQVPVSILERIAN